MKRAVASPPPTHLLALPDGRRLAYAEYGDSRGHPTLYFHGLPGSRLEAVLAADCAVQAGVRLIAIDRPGFGRSDPEPGRRLLDWPLDVLHLADHLGLRRFAVVGVSGGGPYAIVCAYSISQRLDAVGVVSGVAPFETDGFFEHMFWPNKVALRMAKRAPSLVTTGLRPSVMLRSFPRLAVSLLAHAMKTPDREVIARTQVREVLAHSLAESLRQGAQGSVDDLLILARPWGFRLEDVPIDVNVWQGGRDRMVPATHGQTLSRRLIQSHYVYLPEEGHFSLVIDHTASIFSTLMGGRLTETGREVAHRP